MESGTKFNQRINLRIYNKDVIEFLEKKKDETGLSITTIINNLLAYYVQEQKSNKSDILEKNQINNELLLNEILECTKYLKNRYDFINSIEIDSFDEDNILNLKNIVEQYGYKISINEEIQEIAIINPVKFTQTLVPIPSIVKIDKNKEIQVIKYE